MSNLYFTLFLLASVLKQVFISHEELCDLYRSPSFVRIEITRLQWAGHVAHIVKRRNENRIFVRKPPEVQEDGRIIFRWISVKKVVKLGGAWNLLMIISCNAVFGVDSVEPLGSAQ